MAKTFIHEKPQVGQTYVWESEIPKTFTIVEFDHQASHIWIFKALNHDTNVIEEVGFRKRDRYNGWKLVA